MLEPLLGLTADLSADLPAEDRYRRLLGAARELVPCDSIALLRLEGDTLVPLVTEGLRAEALARRFSPAEHPRLARMLAAAGPVRFPRTELPDPFDGLFAEGGDECSRVHACMGCAVHVDGQVAGVLAVDALAPAAFDAISDDVLALLAALAGAAIRTTGLSSALAQLALREQLALRQLVREAIDHVGGELLGASTAMARVRHEIALLASSDLAALITGETGVGKELVAHAIHASSRRSARPMIHVNCAALPESLAESELFGHVRGAFTGAQDHRAGKFELADGGTLFLDEIGELPLSIQPKLLRALQSGEVQRVGADRTLRVDVRVVAATNRDLGAEVRAGRFRSDLYHRLNVYPLEIPPLRDRREDIPLLCGHFLDQAQQRLGIEQLRLTVGARRRLRAHDWSGNVRELEHTLLRGALRASGGRRDGIVVIDVAHLGLAEPLTATPTPTPTPTPVEDGPRYVLRDAVDEFTRKLVLETVTACGGNWAEAARRLGVQRGNLHRLATRLGVHRS